MTHGVSIHCWLAGALLTATAWPATASDSVPRLVVRLKDGTAINGQLDPRTDSKELGLVFSDSGVQVSRSIPWEHVLRVTQGARHLSAEEVLRLRSTELAVDSVRDSGSSAFTVSRLPTAAGIPPPLPCVTHLRAEVAPENWDGDVEPDGLVLQLLPAGDAGAVVPVEGQLTVRLIGRRFDVRHGAHRFVDLGRWQQFVRPFQISHAGAWYRLPYQAIHPDFHLEVGSEGVVHLRLLARGSGPFELTLPVRLRHADWVRDQQQLATGGRFLPGETTRAPAVSRDGRGVPHF